MTRFFLINPNKTCLSTCFVQKRTILGSQNSYKTHKLTNNWLSNFGSIEEMRHLSGILLAIIAETLDLTFSSLIFLARVNVLCKDMKKVTRPMCVAQGFSNYYQAEFEKVFRRKCRITSLPNALHTRVYFKLLMSVMSMEVY